MRYSPGAAPWGCGLVTNILLHQRAEEALEDVGERDME